MGIHSEVEEEKIEWRGEGKIYGIDKRVSLDLTEKSRAER